MLANDKNHRFTYVRRLIVLPLLAVVVVLFAFRNKGYKSHPPISVSTVMESMVQSLAAPGNSRRTGDFITLSLANRPVSLNKTYVVVIDAGHGGQDKGALAADGTTEALLNLALAKAVKQANNNSNVAIVLTRNDDSYQSVVEKAQFANAQKADLFLSIHCNSTGQEEIENNRTGEGLSKGIDLIVASEEKAQDYKANYQLANYMANSLSAVNQLRGIHSRKQGIWVLQAVNCPSVMVEAGFMSNQADLVKLRETGYQQKFAASIVDGIQQYLHAKENGTILPVAVATVPPVKHVPVNDDASRSFDTTGKNSPLLVLNEKIESRGVLLLKEINPNDISAVHVLKSDSALSKYGNEGRNGVIKITLKNVKGNDGRIEKEAIDTAVAKKATKQNG